MVYGGAYTSVYTYPHTMSLQRWAATTPTYTNCITKSAHIIVLPFITDVHLTQGSNLIINVLRKIILVLNSYYSICDGTIMFNARYLNLSSHLIAMQEIRTRTCTPMQNFLKFFRVKRILSNRFEDIRALHFFFSWSRVRVVPLLVVPNKILVWLISRWKSISVTSSFTYSAIGLSLLAAHNCPDSLCLKDWFSHTSGLRYDRITTLLLLSAECTIYTARMQLCEKKCTGKNINGWFKLINVEGIDAISSLFFQAN